MSRCPLRSGPDIAACLRQSLERADLVEALPDLVRSQLIPPYEYLIQARQIIWFVGRHHIEGRARKDPGTVVDMVCARVVFADRANGTRAPPCSARPVDTVVIFVAATVYRVVVIR